MAVALDTVDEFAQWNVTNPVTKLFTPVGTPRGIVVGIGQVTSTTDEITAVTYGGVALTHIASAVIPTGGRSYLYFLGTGIPTGAQTVSISTTGAGSTRWAAVASVTALADTVMPTFNFLQVSPGTNPSITLNTTGPSLRMSIIQWFSAPPSSLVELAGMAAPVAVAEHDYGGNSAKLGRQSGPTSGSYTIGYTAPNSTSMMVAGAIEESIPPAPPDEPVLSVTTISGTQIDLSWADVADETGYRIERSPDGSTGWTDISGNLAAGTVAYSDTGLTCGTDYWYRLYAFNAAGDSTPDTEVGTTLDCPPAAPTLLNVVAEGWRSIDIAWTDNASDEDGFRIEVSPDGVGSWTVQDDTYSPDIEAITVGNAFGWLTPSTSYWFRVVAYNPGGDSAPSNVVQGDTVAQPTVTSMSPPVISQGTLVTLTGTGLTAQSFQYGAVLYSSDYNQTLPQTTTFVSPTEVTFVADLTGIDLGPGFVTLEGNGLYFEFPATFTVAPASGNRMGGTGAIRKPPRG